MSERRMLRDVLFFPGGQVAALDDAGEQVPSLQVNASYVVLKRMESQGVLRPDTRISIGGVCKDVPWEEFRRERSAFFEFREEEEEAP